MSQIETFRYDDEIVRKFLLATIVWGVVGLLLGVIIATQLVFWETNLGPWFSFGRLRPLHTNAVIFAFVGNGMFAGIYHSMQRLCKARMFSDALSNSWLENPYPSAGDDGLDQPAAGGCSHVRKFRHRRPQFPAAEKTIPRLIPCNSHQLPYTVSNLEPFS